MGEHWLSLVAERGREIAPAFLWGAALVVGVGYAARSARRAGLDERAAYWAGICGVAFGLIGSRLLAMALYETSDAQSGGRTFYGGLLAGAAGAFGYLRLRRLPVLAYADAIAPACALAYGVGRVGCFFNGDDFGVLAHGPFAVRYPPGTDAYVDQLRRGLIVGGAPWARPVLATTLLHAALGVALFFLLRRTWRRPGSRLGAFALAYGAGRFGLEALRGDAVPLVGSLSVHQGISLAVAAMGAWLLVRVLRAGLGVVEAQ